MELEWRGREDGLTKFKAYSKLTHLLKAGAAGAGKGFQPMTMSVVKARIAALQSWKERIQQAAPHLGKACGWNSPCKHHRQQKRKLQQKQADTWTHRISSQKQQGMSSC